MKKIPAHLQLRTVGFIRPELLLFDCRRKTNKNLNTRLLSSQRRESLLPTARWSSAQLFFHPLFTEFCRVLDIWMSWVFFLPHPK